MLLQVVCVIVYAVYLLGPGLLVSHLLGWRRNSFFLAYGCGISVLVFSQIPFRIWGGEVTYWYVLVHGIYLLMLAGALSVRSMWARQRYQVSRRLLRYPSLGLVGVVISFTIYHLTVGPYTEIPSDFWMRLGHVTDQLVLVESGWFEANSGISRLIDNTAYIPFLHAIVAHQSGELPLWLVTPTTLVTSLIFLVATYWFTLRLVARVKISKGQKVAIACLAVVLTMVTYGVATFSYVRYYAYFPHMLNAALLLVVVALFLDYLERPTTRFITLIAVGIFLFVMVIVNQQEALMALVLLAGISIWKLIRTFPRVRHGTTLRVERIKTVGWIVLFLSIAALVTGFLIGTPGPWGEPHLVNLSQQLPFLDGWYVANPKLRFWDTLGLFGIVVYVWYVLRWRWFRGLDYINVAMASPVFTLFNPLFVLWFLYVSSWDPLWRLAYLMPLPIVASYLVVRSLDFRPIRRSIGGIVLDCSFTTLLALCLLSFQTGLIDNSNSRLPSLVNVDQSNGSPLWADLVEYIESLEGNQVFVTDSATNYVLSTALKHQGLPRPKERWQHGHNFFEGDYKDKLLYWGMDDKLLVVNNRDGALSANGELSGHWPADILKVSKTYPPDLLDFIDNRPLDFRLMWQNDGIRAYRILRNPAHYD